MSEEVFVEGRTPALKRDLDKRAIEAGVDLNSMRVSPDGRGYLVPGELAPKKTTRRRKEKASESDGDEETREASDQGGVPQPGEGEN